MTIKKDKSVDLKMDIERSKFGVFLLDPPEEPIDASANDYIKRLLDTDSIHSRLDIVTSETAQFKEEALLKQSTELHKTSEERSVDLTETKSNHREDTWKFIVAIASFIILVILATLSDKINITHSEYVSKILGSLLIASIISALGFGISCLISHLNACEVAYVGGTIYFDELQHEKPETTDNQRQIKLARDSILDRQYIKQTVQAEENPQLNSPTTDVLNEIRNYSDLLKEGLVSLDEFLKNERQNF